MAFYDSLNYTPATNAEAIYLFKETMKLAGWTVTSSSDGTTYNSSGDQITSFASGAGGMNNDNAWFVLQQPLLDGHQRWIALQCTGGTTKYQLKVAICWTLPTGGNATTMDSSADQKYICGGQFSYTSVMYPTNGNIINNIRCGDADEKYHFYWFNTLVSVAGVGFLFTIDYVDNTNSLDIDKYVYIIGGSTSHPYTSFNNFNATNLLFNQDPSYFGCVGWVKKGMNGGECIKLAISHLGDVNSGNYSAVGMAPNPFDGNVEVFPAILVSTFDANVPSTLYGIKGTLRNIVISGTTVATSSTLSIDSLRDKIFVGPAIFKWNGSVPSI